MPTKTWKAVELQIAKFFGVERNPLSGMNSKHTSSDTLHRWLYIECKYGKTLPKFFTNLWEDTKKKAKEECKIPLLALKPKNYDGFLIVCDSKNFTQIIEEKELMK